MLERIQTLFERFVGVPVYPCQHTLPMPRRLPEQLERPACWRRHKRISGQRTGRSGATGKC